MILGYEHAQDVELMWLSLPVICSQIYTLVCVLEESPRIATTRLFRVFVFVELRDTIPHLDCIERAWVMVHTIFLIFFYSTLTCHRRFDKTREVFDLGSAARIKPQCRNMRQRNIMKKTFVMWICLLFFCSHFPLTLNPLTSTSPASFNPSPFPPPCFRLSRNRPACPTCSSNLTCSTRGGGGGGVFNGCDKLHEVRTIHNTTRRKKRKFLKE